jgi:hypothetical protein
VGVDSGQCCHGCLNGGGIDRLSGGEVLQRDAVHEDSERSRGLVSDDGCQDLADLVQPRQGQWA